VLITIEKKAFGTVKTFDRLIKKPEINRLPGMDIKNGAAIS